MKSVSKVTIHFRSSAVLHFLVDASLPGPTATVIRACGHDATDVRDIGLRAATDDQIAAYARTNRFSIISADGDFGDVTTYPPANYEGLVVIQPPRRANRAVILMLIEQFLNTTDVTSVLPGRLAIVEPGRIRLRPAP